MPRVLLIDPDGALESTVHRISTQQAGPFDQVVRRAAAAHHDSTQAQGIAAAGLLDQQPRHQATDATEAV